ncbi:alpha-amylase family glycosyl hydrolase [Paenibacillus antarcticus]|uniref:Alpha-amylase n=1 Tax=Paenibacillus antarcticus TaxID=253703 RepID=A0A168NCN4_9BACL|nr:alpha-amylase family glycosyl hydrolase [Paenibacillus antarcticus]OAB45653.1 alpha-amylase [Paenibacillus antarcticus]
MDNCKSNRHTKRLNIGLIGIILLGNILAGCNKDNLNVTQPEENKQKTSLPMSTSQNKFPSNSTSVDLIDEQPSTVYYELFVRSFYDSNGDGIGDLRGVIEKLDYLNDGNPSTTDDLGVGGIWLMPIQSSPSYHGYDVTDYRSINPEYGTMADMKTLVDEAHKRGMKVIMDLVVNHTSKEHLWFKESAESKLSPYRDWYVWAEDQKREPNGTSAASGANPWYEMNGNHYLAGFWDGMPDLNFDNEAVRSEMKDVGQYWLKLGLDGFRLDAAKHIFEDLITDKNKEVEAKNVAWWQEFRSSMNEINTEAYIVGEVWENSVTSVAPYLDKAFDSGFNFSLAESIISSVKSERDSNMAFTLERTYKLFNAKSEGNFIDAVFLTNHDQNRVMSQLDRNMEHAKMAASILLTLPGNPFIYYGEEIGMLGAKPDEQIREPMIWYKDGGKGKGQTTWEEPVLNTGVHIGSVESQMNEKDSLLAHYQELLRWRNEITAIHDGNIQYYDTGNIQIISYVRHTNTEEVLVVHNVSSEEQQIVLEGEGEEHKYTDILKSTNRNTNINSNFLLISPYTSVVLK